MTLIVPDEAYPYLVAQKGRLDDAARQGRAAWELAYREDMVEAIRGLLPYLPGRVSNVLDIGGGIGGIDALLNRYYGGDLRVSILDGKADDPICLAHAETFNDMDVTRRFLQLNGVKSVVGRFPTAPGAPEPYDLILSLQSWCFHYEPQAYLGFVKACCHNGTRIIVDVRRGRPAWLADMHDAFHRLGIVRTEAKFNRYVFGVR